MITPRNKKQTNKQTKRQWLQSLDQVWGSSYLLGSHKNTFLGLIQLGLY